MKYTDAETNTQTKEGLFVDADCQSGNEHNKRMYLIIKRIQDIVLSFIALGVLLPLLLIIALIIFIDDGKQISSSPLKWDWFLNILFPMIIWDSFIGSVIFINS